MEILKARLSPVLHPDEHQNGACYRIRSLYFDDESDSAVRMGAVFDGDHSGSGDTGSCDHGVVARGGKHLRYRVL